MLFRAGAVVYVVVSAMCVYAAFLEELLYWQQQFHPDQLFAVSLLDFELKLK
jgi:hypothetical protein